MELLLVFFSLVGGMCLALIVKYIFEIPFPWELRVRNPIPSNPEVLANCFNKLKDGGTLDIVMGEMNSEICMEDCVLKALQNTLDRKVEIRMICGPTVDKNSEEFLKLLGEPKVAKVELYKLISRPSEHFRIVNKNLVYVEPPHPPFVYTGYISVKSKRIAREFTALFEEMKKNAVKCTITEFQLVERAKA